MKKTFAISLLILCFVVQGIAQNTSSPYSRFGIGDLAENTFGQYQALGGTSIGIRNSYHLNINNPAANSAFDSLSFNFEFGVFGKLTNYRTGDLSESKTDANINYFAGGFPITPWWSASFGLLPYSNVGYEIQSTGSFSIPGEGVQNYATNYAGSGGINQVFISSTFYYKDYLSFGVNGKYLFGETQYNRVVTFLDEDGATDADYFSTKESSTVFVRDFAFDFGLQGHFSLGSKYDLTLGAVYAMNQEITADEKLYLEKVNTSGVLDTILNTGNVEKSFTLPQRLGFGASLTSENWLFAADYSLQNWSEVSFLGSDDSLANSNRFSLGVEYIPNPRNVISYFSRVRYRVGGHYSNTYLNLNGEQLNDFGISFGLGLPLRRTKSVVNVGFEFGKRGTKDFNLIEENYGIISLSLSLHDIWFMKRKFD